MKDNTLIIFKKSYIVLAFIICSFFFVKSSFSAVSPPWTFSFDCGREYTLKVGTSDWSEFSACEPGVSPGGGWTSPEGHYQQILFDANNPQGAGGAGSRQMIGTGKNANTGGIIVTFDSRQQEFWLRWYYRFEYGFFWNWINGKKLLYFDMGETGQWQPKILGFDSMGFRLYDGSQGDIEVHGYGWDDIMASGPNDVNGHKASDGLWHYLEIHIRYESASGLQDGIAEMWSDGKLIISKPVNFGSTLGAKTFIAPSNQEEPGVSSEMYLDYDDFALSTTGYIGPIGPGNSDTTSPTVSITNPAQGQTLSGTFTIIADAQDNVSIADVQFQMDGQSYGSKVSQSPYQYSINTLNITNGTHTISATATDTSGNQTTSNSISFIVNNNEINIETPPFSSLFSESFEDTNFAARGWYDNINLSLSTTEHTPGRLSSAEFHFLQGATTPTSGAAIRKKFTDSEEVYVKYHVKYSSNWTGSNKSYHPHEFMLLTNLDSDYSNLAYTHLTVYIEQNEGEPLLSIQDGQNIDETQIGVDLTNITENRAVAGCNGDSDGYGDGACYQSGDVHWNHKQWRAGSVFFQDNLGAYYKNDWHTVEAYIKLNSISGEKAVADGQLKYWFDGNLIINHNDVMLRTGQHPDMKFNQFVIAPWIGDGSPIDQTMWVDELSISTRKPTNIPTITNPK